MSKNKALVLLSGGQDSTTCLYWALRAFEEVEAVGFFYGQRHSIEQEFAIDNAARANVPFKVINLEGVFGGSALVDHSQDVSGAHQVNPSLPSTFTAGRNIVFLSVAGGIAYNKRISNLVTGVCQTDFSGYPDCRAPFIGAMQQALRFGLGAEINIHTPLMNLTKAETWKLAKDLQILDVIIKNTMTDYNGDKTLNEWGYGKEDNPATILRANGYREAKTRGWL